MRQQARVAILSPGDPAAVAAALARVPTRARTLRVYREREQRDADGRDWADYLGPSREDGPELVTRDRGAAAAALLAIMTDASMGGHRYGRIEAGRITIATVSYTGAVVVGLGVSLMWTGDRPLWHADAALRSEARP